MTLRAKDSTSELSISVPWTAFEWIECFRSGAAGFAGTSSKWAMMSLIIKPHIRHFLHAIRDTTPSSFIGQHPYLLCFLIIINIILLLLLVCSFNSAEICQLMQCFFLLINVPVMSIFPVYGYGSRGKPPKKPFVSVHLKSQTCRWLTSP